MGPSHRRIKPFLCYQSILTVLQGNHLVQALSFGMRDLAVHTDKPRFTPWVRVQTSPRCSLQHQESVIASYGKGRARICKRHSSLFSRTAPKREWKLLKLRTADFVAELSEEPRVLVGYLPFAQHWVLARSLFLRPLRHGVALRPLSLRRQGLDQHVAAEHVRVIVEETTAGACSDFAEAAVHVEAGLGVEAGRLGLEAAEGAFRRRRRRRLLRSPR